MRSEEVGGEVRSGEEEKAMGSEEGDTRGKKRRNGRRGGARKREREGGEEKRS